MKFHKNKDLLEKLLFLKAIGYNFIDENFLNLSKYQDYNSIDELNSEIKKCSLCFLRNSSKCVSTGFGDKNSKIMFVIWIFDKPLSLHITMGSAFSDNVIIL